MFPKCLLGIFLSVYICSKDISVLFTHTQRVTTSGNHTHADTDTHTQARTHTCMHTHTPCFSKQHNSWFFSCYIQLLIYCTLIFHLHLQRFEMKRLSDIIVTGYHSNIYFYDYNLKRKAVLYTHSNLKTFGDRVFGTFMS